MSFEDKRFCVYLHRRKDTNEVFYVGSGTTLRPYDKRNRSVVWNEIVNNFGYTSEIIHENLTKMQATELEKDLIWKFKNTIVNQRQPIIHLTPTVSALLDKYIIDPNSPSGLSYAKEVRSGIHGNRIQHRVGDWAGTVDGKGYYSVVLLGRLHKAHRLVYLASYGEIPVGHVIDHIDGDRKNNKIENLRAVSQQKNCQNRRVSKNNITGVNGVAYSSKKDVYTAVFSWLHTNMSKSFSCKKYGKEQALQLAIEWRKQKEKEHGFNPDCTDQTPDSR